MRRKEEEEEKEEGVLLRACSPCRGVRASPSVYSEGQITSHFVIPVSRNTTLVLLTEVPEGRHPALF